MHTTPPRRPMEHHSLAEIRARLADFTPETAASRSAKRVAAVAMVLRHGEDGALEVLFMQRATREDDPWSGQMAFPGGHVDADDPSVEAAARRETLEEVGLALTPDMLLGRLSDVVGGRLRTFELAVCPLVYYCPDPGELVHNHEVSATVWVPLAYLGDGRNISSYYYEQQAFSGFSYGPYTIWGLTYRILAQFMGIFGIALPTAWPMTQGE
ncbi:MAG: CoA pyrophosphatase [Candidatus Hydrogenedentes bacterium]|nr:CoA pyrophosphatase [Candidatus Hydrogenedentota bacterium]